MLEIDKLDCVSNKYIDATLVIVLYPHASIVQYNDTAPKTRTLEQESFDKHKISLFDFIKLELQAPSAKQYIFASVSNDSIESSLVQIAEFAHESFAKQNILPKFVCIIFAP